MSEAEQLENPLELEAVEAPVHPQLLVEWEPVWLAFKGALVPAFSRASEPLAGECNLGWSPGPSAPTSLMLHIACLLAWSSLSLLHLGWMVRGAPTPTKESEFRYPLLYYKGASLPRMEDAGGAQAGRSGRSGGREAFHPRQTIRVARGPSPVRVVVDTPKLLLPRRNGAVANLIAFSGAALPPPPLSPVREVAKLMPRGVTGGIEVEPPRVDLVQPLEPAKLLLPPPGELKPSTIPPGTGGEKPLPKEDNSSPTGAREEGNGLLAGREDAVVLSVQSGQQVGAPDSGESGSLAMSPSGTEGTGLGGAGGGSGIGRGTGPGSGQTGEGTGAAAAGPGLGSDPNATGGISPGRGPGGSGNGGGSSSPIAGITIRGGQVFLPSFASPPVLPQGKNLPLGPRRAPSVTVIATSHSGGAVKDYGIFRGSKVHTIYFDTSVGTAILQFSERSSGGLGFDNDLTAPEPLQVEFPPDTVKSHVVVACVIDESGMLREFRILEATARDLATRVVASLRQWRFRPVLRGEQAIEVDAIIGFDVSTR